MKEETESALIPKAYAEELPSVPKPKPCTVEWPAESVNLDKLAYAVGMYETSQCTNPGSPTANARNNCHGSMRKGSPITFASTDESTAFFKANWKKNYGGYPTFAQARTYSGNDRACTWLKNVNRFYLQ